MKKSNLKSLKLNKDLISDFSMTKINGGAPWSGKTLCNQVCDGPPPTRNRVSGCICL